MLRLFSLPAKPILTLFQPNDTRLLCSFAAKNKNIGKIQVNTKRYHCGSDFFVTQLRNRFGWKNYGTEIFKLDKNGDTIEGMMMEVPKKYRNKDLHLGETLRLASIVEMLENNLKAIKIRSLDSAVYFHSKYKFIPTMTTKDEYRGILSSIIDNPCKSSAMQKEATELLEVINKNETRDLPTAIGKKCNNLADRYIKEVLKEKDAYKSHPMQYWMKMELTRDNVLNNKDYFNGLFKKHGIDYSIA